MREGTPGEIHRAVESEIRQALIQRVADADGYAHKRQMGQMNPTTMMTILKGVLKVTITIQSEWENEEPQLETK